MNEMAVRNTDLTLEKRKDRLRTKNKRTGLQITAITNNNKI